MPNVTYERIGTVNTEQPGATLLSVALEHDIAHYSACGGHAKCSTCRVLVVSGVDNLTPRTRAETALVEKKGLSKDIRLACQARVMGPVTIRRLVLDNRDAETAYTGAKGAGEAMHIAVLFSDIRGFTSFSENNYAYDVMHILNRYLFGVGESIHRHNGYIDKYMGDGVMALFGLSGQGPLQASREAVAAAIDMVEDLRGFNVYMLEQFGERFEVGIGIHVGEVVVGEMGHPERRQLTALGDVVNTASRIESATKEFGARILISEQVRELIEDELTSGRVVEATMKGKKDAHRLTEVLSLTPREERKAPAALYHAVLDGVSLVDAPGLLRLAFHDAVTGGTNGSVCSKESLAHPFNAGLKSSVDALKTLRKTLPRDVSWADLIALAGAAAVERCGGPRIPLRVGRLDNLAAFSASDIPERGDDAKHLKARFARLGLGVQDLVALSGAHTIGKADGTPFTAEPFSFDNGYFRALLEPDSTLLNSDKALLTDPEMRAWVEEYASDESAFFADFVAAYRRLFAIPTERP